MQETTALDESGQDTVSNQVAQIAAAIVGQVTVSPQQSIAVDIFWPSQDPSLWSQISGQVGNLISQNTAQTNYGQMASTLNTLQGAISSYLQLTNPQDQQTRIDAIAKQFTDAWPTFMSGDPASNFSLAWSMALLHLTVLQWRVQAWAAAQSTPPNTAPATDLQNAAISYALYGRVGLSRIYNCRMSQLQATEVSTQVPGKASAWNVTFTLFDSAVNNYLVEYMRTMNPWSPREVNSCVHREHERLQSAWNKVANTTQSTLDGIAFNAIQTLEAQWSYTQQQALGLLSTGVFAIPDFQGTYYPTASIYNNPDTTPQQSTPQLPPMPAPPPE